MALPLKSSINSRLNSSTTTTYHSYSLPRLVLYVQNTHDIHGRAVSLLPLVHQPGIALTHLIVGALHVTPDRGVLLNDWPPNDARFATLWEEVNFLRETAGIRVMAMVGGAAAGSFGADTLDSDDAAIFHRHYNQLRDVLVRHRLQGVDLDVEERMSQAGITRLVRRLASDFRSGDQEERNTFEITLAPVAAALLPQHPDNTFSYAALERDAGRHIAFYNAQFYNGWGTGGSPELYEAICGGGKDSTGRTSTRWPPEKILLGGLTSPRNGNGFVPAGAVQSTVASLRATYEDRTGHDDKDDNEDHYHHQIGGVMGWEYYNSEPGGRSAPWVWAQQMTAILRRGLEPGVNLTRVLEV